MSVHLTGAFYGRVVLIAIKVLKLGERKKSVSRLVGFYSRHPIITHSSILK